MANKYLGIDPTNGISEISPATTSAGAANAGQIVALNASGLLDSTLLGAMNVSNTRQKTASEAIAAGAFVNISGTSVRNADNSAFGKEANGFAAASIASGATGPIVVGSGLNSYLTGLTAGSVYYLGTVGGFTTTPPTATGSVYQRLGRADSTTELSFTEQTPITRA